MWSTSPSSYLEPECTWECVITMLMIILCDVEGNKSESSQPKNTEGMVSMATKFFQKISHMWQSQVEMKHYSVARVTAFEAL